MSASILSLTWPLTPNNRNHAVDVCLLLLVRYTYALFGNEDTTSGKLSFSAMYCRVLVSGIAYYL